MLGRALPPRSAMARTMLRKGRDAYLRADHAGRVDREGRPRRSAWCAGRYPTADRVTRGSAPMHPGAALTTRPQSRGSWFLPQPLVSAAENWAALRTSCHSCPQGSVPSELAFRVSLPSFRASARGVSETPFRGCRSRPRSIQEADRGLPFPIPPPADGRRRRVLEIRFVVDGTRTRPDWSFP